MATDDPRVMAKNLTEWFERETEGSAAYSQADWRGRPTAKIGAGKQPEMHDGLVVIKRELLPDGRQKLILKNPATGSGSFLLQIAI